MLTFAVFQSIGVCPVWKDCKYKVKYRCSFILRSSLRTRPLILSGPVAL